MLHNCINKRRGRHTSNVEETFTELEIHIKLGGLDQARTGTWEHSALFVSSPIGETPPRVAWCDDNKAKQMADQPQPQNDVPRTPIKKDHRWWKTGAVAGKA